MGTDREGQKVNDLMGGLWVLREVIPEHVRILEMRLRVALLSVNEVRKLCGIAQEENWMIVSGGT